MTWLQIHSAPLRVLPKPRPASSSQVRQSPFGACWLRPPAPIVLDRFELAVTRPFQERRQLFWRQRCESSRQISGKHGTVGAPPDTSGAVVVGSAGNLRITRPELPTTRTKTGSPCLIPRSFG